MRLLALSLIVALLIPVRIAGERLAAGAAATAFARIPRHFEPNQGQTPQREILFLSAGDSHLLGISANGILLMDRQGRTAQLTFIGARVPVEVSGTDPLPSVTNYLYGQDPSTWRTAVPHFQRVKLANVYAGIDVVFYVSGRDIEYDFELAAGVDPQQIRMSWDSARKLQLEANGDLTAQTAAGPVTLAQPKAWQPRGIHRREVEVRFAIDAGSGQFGFVTGPYDSSLPLTIDPTLSYAGFIGGSQYDEARGIAVDAQGNAYYCGLLEVRISPPPNHSKPHSRGAMVTLSLQRSTVREPRCSTSPISAAAVGTRQTALPWMRTAMPTWQDSRIPPTSR